MSGGSFSYANDNLMIELFNGFSYDADLRSIRKVDPFDDKVISEMAFDLLKLIHVLDYYRACDSSEMYYRIAVKEFKDKWFPKGLSEPVVKRIVDDSVDQLKEDLLNSLNAETPMVPEKCSCGAGYPSYDYPRGKCRMYCSKCGKEVFADDVEDVVKKWNENLRQGN